MNGNNGLLTQMIKGNHRSIHTQDIYKS